MLTDLLIDIGGISRAFIISGLIASSLAAVHLYKAALIKDLFMLQTEAREPHPTFKSFEDLQKK